MSRVIRFAAYWIGGWAVTGVVVGLILGAILKLSALGLVGMAFSGLMGGFALGIGIAETIVLVGGAFELDDRGSTFPRLRRLVGLFDRSFPFGG